jgi:hypothetical protein
MAHGQHALDRRPGCLPEIRTNVDGVTFTMGPPGIPKGAQLIIRCDAAGQIWIAIRPDGTQLE